jgi:hypothetical protein
MGFCTVAAIMQKFMAAHTSVCWQLPHMPLHNYNCLQLPTVPQTVPVWNNRNFKQVWLPWARTVYKRRWRRRIAQLKIFVSGQLYLVLPLNVCRPYVGNPSRFAVRPDPGISGLHTLLLDLPLQLFCVQCLPFHVVGWCSGGWLQLSWYLLCHRVLSSRYSMLFGDEESSMF